MRGSSAGSGETYNRDCMSEERERGANNSNNNNVGWENGLTFLSSGDVKFDIIGFLLFSTRKHIWIWCEICSWAPEFSYGVPSASREVVRAWFVRDLEVPKVASVWPPEKRKRRLAWAARVRLAPRKLWESERQFPGNFLRLCDPTICHALYIKWCMASSFRLSQHSQQKREVGAESTCRKHN